MTTTEDTAQDGTAMLHEQRAEFDPADYENVRDALREAPAGYGAESVIDHFDPVVDGGHQVNTDV